MLGKRQILTGVFVLAVTAASAVAITAYQRGGFPTGAASDSGSAVQSLLSEAQRQAERRTGTDLLDRLSGQAPAPDRLATQAVTPPDGPSATPVVLPSSGTPGRPTPPDATARDPGEQPTLSPGAEPAPVAPSAPTTAEPASQTPAPPSFVPTSSRAPAGTSRGIVPRGGAARAVAPPEMCR